MNWLELAFEQVAEGVGVVADHALYAIRSDSVDALGECPTCKQEAVPFSGWVPASRLEPGYWLRDDGDCAVCAALNNPPVSAHRIGGRVCYCVDDTHWHGWTAPIVRYAVRVLVDSVWAGNAMTYESRREAEEAGRDLAARWTLVKDWRVVEA